MKRRFMIFLSILSLGVFLAGPAFAGDPDEGIPSGPSVASPFPPQAPEPNVFGTQTNILQIPASSFVPWGGAWDVVYDSMGYVHRSGGGAMWATVTLPAGANIQWLDLYYYDTSAGSDITATLRAYYGGDFWGTVPNYIDIASVSSSGSGGYGYAVSSYFSHTVNNDVAYGGGYQYTVNVVLPVGDGSLGFKGVDLWWNRQISPAPATATFSDVPTSHPFFQEIEALAASGITTGYSDGTFRPNNYVTRQALAAYLARALGLHWSH